VRDYSTAEDDELDEEVEADSHVRQFDYPLLARAEPCYLQE
jgi:hypothetical protein